MLLNELRRRSDLRAVYVSMCLQLGMSTCLRAAIPLVQRMRTSYYRENTVG
jgi:hypothetical protein